MPEQKDPEKDSDFARGKALAKEKGTPPGIDPETGERAAVTYRQLFNETNGDEKKAREIFEAVAKAGGFGDVALDQALDVRSLSRSVDDAKDALSRGVDLKGQELDLYGRREMEQRIQHQGNLVEDVGKALDQLKKG